MTAKLLRFDNPRPPGTKVCGNCVHYTRDNTIPSWSSCHAVGGLKAHDVWPECHGSMWQEKHSFVGRMVVWLQRKKEKSGD